MSRRSTLGRILSALIVACIALPMSAIPSESGEPVIVGQRFHIQSRHMEEMRSFLVHKPANYGLTTAAYPVLIVLDGDDHFRHVSATVDFLSAAERIPQMIVVGVPNTDRGRDLIPPVQSVNPPVLTDNIGGPEKFLAFIGDELIPEIERRYRTRSYRALVGHSDAGLFVIYSLIAKPALFKGYVSISPAFGDNRGLAKQVEPFLLAHKDLKADLFVTIANERGQLAGGVWELSSYLQEKASRDLRWQLRRYPEETHSSTALRSVYDGLQAIFDGWYVQDPFALYEQGGLAGIEKNYAVLSARVGYAVSIPESTLTPIFVALEGRSRFNEAEIIIKKMDELYPNSPYVHFYAGRLYRKMQDESKATQHLTQSLMLSPSFSGSRRMLKEVNVDIAPIVPEITLTPKAQTAFVGRYGGSEVDLEVLQRGGKLYAKTAQREYELQAMTDSKFYYKNGEGILVFRKNGRARVSGLFLQSNGLELSRLK